MSEALPSLLEPLGLSCLGWRQGSETAAGRGPPGPVTRTCDVHPAGLRESAALAPPGPPASHLTGAETQSISHPPEAA